MDLWYQEHPSSPSQFAPTLQRCYSTSKTTPKNEMKYNKIKNLIIEQKKRMNECRRTTSALRNKWLWLELEEESWEWRELSLSWAREHPIIVWPLLANSRASALPSPLLTPVISTVRHPLLLTGDAPPPPPAPLIIFSFPFPSNLLLFLCYALYAIYLV